MLPILQSSNKSIKFFIINGVIDMIPFEFLTKISYGVALLKEDNPNAYTGGITFYFKCFSKVRMGTLVNLSFKVIKAFSSSCPHLKTTSFFTIAFNGAEIVLKSFTNLL